jgi:hypothetical protein
MVSNMKTTIDIPDSLLQEAKRLSRKKGLTLRTLVEEGLREVIVRHTSNKKFELQKASFKGNGLQREFRGASWEEFRAAAYGDHGG